MVSCGGNHDSHEQNHWFCEAVRSFSTPNREWGDSLYVCNCYYIDKGDTVSVNDSLYVYPEILGSDDISDYEDANDEIRANK